MRVKRGNIYRCVYISVYIYFSVYWFAFACPNLKGLTWRCFCLFVGFFLRHWSRQNFLLESHRWFPRNSVISASCSRVTRDFDKKVGRGGTEVEFLAQERDKVESW